MYQRCRGKRITVMDAPLLPDEKCPRCGKPLLMKNGAYGLFVGCSGFPACRFSKRFRFHQFEPV